MTVPLAFLNGEFLSLEHVRLPVYDLGIVQGATVTERLRTVRHQPLQVVEHLDRLEQSLDLVGWEHPPQRRELEDAITRVASHNAQLIAPDDDLSIVVFVTAGPFLPDAFGLAELPIRPTVCVHAAPLPQQQWEPLYRGGVHLYTSAIRQIPADCIDPRIKHRSRLGWHLADRQVRRHDPLGVALLQDQAGFVTETSSANLFVVNAGRLYTPRRETTLPGIMQATLVTLAEETGISVHRTDISVDDLQDADEAFLTSSTFLLMPATQCNGRSLGTGLVGDLTRHLSERLRHRLGIGPVASGA